MWKNHEQTWILKFLLNSQNIRSSYYRLTTFMNWKPTFHLTSTVAWLGTLWQKTKYLHQYETQFTTGTIPVEGLFESLVDIRNKGRSGNWTYNSQGILLLSMEMTRDEQSVRNTIHEIHVIQYVRTFMAMPRPL